MASEIDKQSAILSSESFQRLLRLRGGIRFTLGFLVLLLHGVFVGGIAFYNQWFNQPLSQGSTITVGIAMAAFVIVLMVLLEALYIWISQKVFDPLQQQVLSQVSHHE